jgi:hypothetical protein
MTRTKASALALLVAGTLVLGLVPSRADDKEGGWTPLFNGKDLSGWTRYLDPKKQADPDKIWTVHDGMIDCEGSVNGYLLTDKEFSNYVLRVQWRWGDKVTSQRNSGVFVHVSGPDKIWPKGVEAQLFSGHAGDIWLVDGFKLRVDKSRQDPKTPRHFLHTKDGVEKPIGEWNEYEITCKGDTIKLVVNGQELNEGTHAEHSRGKILLQSEGAEILFRNIELKHLPSQPGRGPRRGAKKKDE